MIEVKDFSFKYVRGKDFILKDLNFRISKGEKVLLLGPSGVGKSTLLHLMAGVISQEEGTHKGSLQFQSKVPPAMVLQDPDAQIVMHTIGDDVAFTCENYAVPTEKIWPQVAESLEQVSLDFPIEHDSYELSGGQKQRLALANMLAISPDVLLLDEPTANLDTQGALEIKDAVLKSVQTHGQTLVIVEHNVSLWADDVDRVIVIGKLGHIILDDDAKKVFTDQEFLETLNVWYPGLVPNYQKYSNPQHQHRVLEVKDLSVGYDDRTILKNINHEFLSGQAYALLGKNGTGKSTLAMTLAGLQEKLAGTMTPDFVAMSSSQMAEHIRTVFQNPEHQFVYDTVAQELAHVDQKIIEALSLNSLLESNPFTLSGGQKRRLSVATAINNHAEIIFLDEPTFGQDPKHWLVLCQLLQEEMQKGTCLILSTHDSYLIDALSAQKIEVEQWS